jgi:hypothetical protein
MAIAYKNARLLVGTAYSSVYTVPAGTTAIILLAQAANVDGATNAEVSLQWLDASATNAATRLAHTLAVPADAALGLLDGKLVLETGDDLQALASAAGAIELTLSVMEIS